MFRTGIAENRMEKFDLNSEPRSSGIFRRGALVLIITVILATGTHSVVAQSNGSPAQLNIDVTGLFLRSARLYMA